jgi:hypothetical protein
VDGFRFIMRGFFAVFDQVKVGGTEKDFHFALTLALSQKGRGDSARLCGVYRLT